MKVRRVSRMDGGVYWCRASNIFGSSTRAIAVVSVEPGELIWLGYHLQFEYQLAGQKTGIRRRILLFDVLSLICAL
jgi:hypothetical protein